MDPRSKEYKKLQAEWDAILSDTGFKDIEQRKDERLRRWSTDFSLNRDFSQINARQEYYRAAGHFLYDYAFDNEVEKRIWTLHADGVGIREIVKKLREEGLWFEKKRKDAKPCFFSVQLVLKRLTTLMIENMKYDGQDSQE